jgi:hypothetical protein
MIKPDMIRQDYELYLAHQILANPKRFEFLANDIKGKHYKILDNSAYELNKGLSLDLLLKAADIINADEIVLPDIYKSNDSFEYSLKYLTEIPVGFKRKIAMVAQGASIIDLTYSIDKIKRLKRVDTIMLPKWSWAWRMDLMHLLLNTDKTIHWLGMGDRITETVGPYTEMIRSIDTGYFTALASTNYEQSIFNKRIDDIEINLDDMPVREDNLINLMSQQKLFLEEINV